jgi:hypothetical protein
VTGSVLEDLEEIVVEGMFRFRRRPVDLAVEVLKAPCGFRVCREPLVSFLDLAHELVPALFEG